MWPIRAPELRVLDRARIFEPFQQLDTQAINRTEGAGLGLAICKGLVEAHGGRIWVQDRSGPGTIMSFTLPHQSWKCKYFQSAE